MCKIRVDFYQTYHLTGIPNREPEERECKDILEAILYTLPRIFSRDVYHITFTDSWEGREKSIVLQKYVDGKFHIDEYTVEDKLRKTKRESYMGWHDSNIYP